MRWAAYGAGMGERESVPRTTAAGTPGRQRDQTAWMTWGNLNGG